MCGIKMKLSPSELKSLCVFCVSHLNAMKVLVSEGISLLLFTEEIRVQELAVPHDLGDKANS